MIKKLTKQQEEQVGKYHSEWLSHGTNTKPASRAKAEHAITEMYKFAEHKPPRFEWVASPLEAKTKFGCESVWFVGQMDSYWIAFYLYCRDVLGIKYEDKYSRVLDLHAIVAKSCGWWYPFEKAVVVCERPVECHMKNGVLHRDGGMSVRYSDGFGCWNLNGVRVPRDIAETPAERLDPILLTKEKNAEIRREIVRKIGIERIVQKLGAEVVDRQGDYELLLLDLQDGRKREFLKMKNPSLEGVFHIEGVPPGTKTVADALRWRNGIDTPPSVLS